MYKLNTFLLTINIRYPGFGIRYDDYKNCFLENISIYIHKIHTCMHIPIHTFLLSLFYFPFFLTFAYYNIYPIARMRIFLNSSVKII